MTIPYNTIGRFIVECSELEAFLYFALKKLVDASVDELEILLGKPRTTDLIDVMRAVASRKLRGSRGKALAEVLTAAAFVFEIRNVVAHRVPRRSPWGVGLSFEDTYRGRGGKRKWAYECSEEQLQKCITYSGHVSAALLAVVRGQPLAPALAPLRDKDGLPRTLNEDEREGLERHQRRLHALLA